MTNMRPWCAVKLFTYFRKPLFPRGSIWTQLSCWWWWPTCHAGKTQIRAGTWSQTSCPYIDRPCTCQAPHFWESWCDEAQDVQKLQPPDDTTVKTWYLVQHTKFSYSFTLINCFLGLSLFANLNVISKGGVSSHMLWRCINCDTFDVKLNASRSEKLHWDGMRPRKTFWSAARCKVWVDAVLRFERNRARVWSVFDIVSTALSSTVARLQHDSSNLQVTQS